MQKGVAPCEKIKIVFSYLLYFLTWFLRIDFLHISTVHLWVSYELMLENAEKSIIGVFCKVVLKITGGTQNKVKIRPEFAAPRTKTHESNASKFAQSHQFWLTIAYRTISSRFFYIQLMIWSSEDQN